MSVNVRFEVLTSTERLHPVKSSYVVMLVIFILRKKVYIYYSVGFNGSHVVIFCRTS